MNIRALGFIDVSTFTAVLLNRYKKRLDEDGDIILRDDDNEDGEVADRPILKDWKSARALIARIRNAAAPWFEGRPVVFGRICVEKLGVGKFTNWHMDEGDYAETHARLRICLVPSPGAAIYSGGEAMGLLVGTVTMVNHRVLHSELNTGPCAAVYLVIDVRRADAP